jgi:hypothetical protein
LYNLRHVLESEEADDMTEDMIQQLEDRIEQYCQAHPLDSFHAKDTRNIKRKRLGSDASSGGSAGVEDATDCAELAAHSYQVEPRAVVDDKGGVMMTFSKVGQPLSTYAPR